LALLLPCWLIAPADATTIHGRASTVLDWYDSPDDDTAVPVYQYLQFSLVDIADKGFNFKAYGRLADDLTNEIEADSRLYYAYLEKRGVVDGLDFRLGRQFISTTAGASLMDGLKLDYKFGKKYHASLYGGGDVAYYGGYDVKDVVWGGEIGGRFVDDSVDANLSYLQKYDDGLISVELVGLDIDYDWNGRLWLYSDTQVDVISERISYQLLGGKYRFEGPYTLRLEYLYSLPVFSASSIYSVFAVNEYREAVAEGTWAFAPGYQAYGRFTHEFYRDFDDANVYEAGVEKLRRNKTSGYLSAVLRRDDDGQNMYGFKAYVDYQCHPKFRSGVGVNVDVLQREIAFFTSDTDQEETTSTRLWIDARYEITKSINVEAKYEYIESDLWDSYNKGRVQLNFLF
jgi:hypothetical protein